MRILFVGDVVGEPGRRAVTRLVPQLRRQLDAAFVIVNGENAAGGAGITPGTAAELLAAGVDLITTGDHIWDNREVMGLLPKERRLLRPLNYPPGTIGQGSAILRLPDLPPLAVVNLQGRIFMSELENPFLCLQTELLRLRPVTPLIFVDFHAEATSEKIALARMVDGQVSAVVGTHTHVQTADEQILPGGTAYLTDAGFTGPHDSVLGRAIEPVVNKFLTNVPHRFEVATGRVLLQGVIVEVDHKTGRALDIKRVSEPLAQGGR